MTAEEASVIAATRRWIERAVIGLNLCPFARTAFETDGIRYAVSSADDVDALVADLDVELRRLHDADAAECETTLLIHPHVLQDFLDYNDFLDVADATLDALDLGDAIQIASFHPAYQFAETSPDDVENCTNRSPYPMLHLLRQVERRSRRCRVSGHGVDLPIEHRHTAPARRGRLAEALVALSRRRKRVMKKLLVVACVWVAISARAEEIGEVDTVFKWVGPITRS